MTATVATKTPKFLLTLYSLLHTESPAVISWLPCGTFFQVFDPTRLERDVLPRYFKHSKFASFQRQLNNFGFRKWTKTRASVCTFSHDTLVRCMPSELPAMLLCSPPLVTTSTRTASLKRLRDDDILTCVIAHKKNKIDVATQEDERESSSHVSDLLALGWSILSGDHEEVELFEEHDDCVGLPIELFFPHETTCGTIDPLPLCESNQLDAHEWQLLTECLA